MKKIGLLMFCLSTLFMSQAQSITIIDQNSLQPIENVEVYKLNKNTLITKSNQSGIVVLTGIQGAQILVFLNAMYSPITISLDQIKAQGNSLKMSENINSIN